MISIMSAKYSTQNDLLLTNLLKFYNTDNNLEKMLSIINGESNISLRIVDWFATNYAKKIYTTYDIAKNKSSDRFKVYIDYKLKLRAYSKKRFDPFCRWDRITIPYKTGERIQTTLGQLNFFKWAIENEVIDYISDNYKAIEHDLNFRNSTTIKKDHIETNKTRKKREELSISASKSIKKENVVVVVKFN